MSLQADPAKEYSLKDEEDGEFEDRSFYKSTLFRAIAIVLAFVFVGAIVFVVLWFTVLKSSDTRGGTETSDVSGGTEAPDVFGETEDSGGSGGTEASGLPGGSTSNTGPSLAPSSASSSSPPEPKSVSEHDVFDSTQVP